MGSKTLSDEFLDGYIEIDDVIAGIWTDIPWLNAEKINSELSIEGGIRRSGITNLTWTTKIITGFIPRLIIASSLGSSAIANWQAFLDKSWNIVQWCSYINISSKVVATPDWDSVTIWSASNWFYDYMIGYWISVTNIVWDWFIVNGSWKMVWTAFS
jgi:hypothetical protein